MHIIKKKKKTKIKKNRKKKKQNKNKKKQTNKKTNKNNPLYCIVIHTNSVNQQYTSL